jgi:nitrogen regulatory protein P-II 2
MPPLMKTVPLTLLTIIAEALLKERLIHDLREAGAKGFTITDAEGEGARQRRVGEILGANIRVEAIVSDEVADRMLHLLSHDYFERYAVIAFLTTVNVVRGEKYV